jgi:hypothetical protein
MFGTDKYPHDLEGVYEVRIVKGYFRIRQATKVPNRHHFLVQAMP